MLICVLSGTDTLERPNTGRSFLLCNDFLAKPAEYPAESAEKPADYPAESAEKTKDDSGRLNQRHLQILKGMKTDTEYSTLNKSTVISISFLKIRTVCDNIFSRNHTEGLEQ